MTRSLLFLVALAGPPLAAGELPADLDAGAARSLAAWKSPGLAVAVVKGTDTVLLKGYGTTRLGADGPVTPRTLFPMGSCTKALTSALLAGLADDGKLSFDDPVRKHLPDFHLADPAADAKVTLRDLMSHRTGAAAHDFLWYHAPWDRLELVRRIQYLPTSYPFRGGYEYSSVMVMAAGQAAANAGGAPWEDLVRDRLTKPLGMANTVLTSAAAAGVKGRAAGHKLRPDGTVEPMPEYVLTEANPAGSAFTTAADSVAWLRFHLDDGRHDGKRVVSSANLRETRTAQTPMPRTDPEIAAVYPDSARVDYAMGWVVYDYRGREVVAHGGVMDGFRTLILLVPKERLGIALFNNLHHTKLNLAAGHALLDRLLGEKPARDWDAYYLKLEATERAEKAAADKARDAARDPNTRPSAALDQYAGTYTHPAYGEATVALKDGTLHWTWSGFASPLAHDQDDTFRATAGHHAGRLIDFRTRAGRVNALRFIGVVFDRKP